MTGSDRINLHHLHYFWAVAKDGNLTRTAQQLSVAQSALSAQIRQLEHQLGTPLFERAGRKLLLTEAGRIAVDYAEEIFTRSGELLSTLQEGRQSAQPLRVGAVATLSRNFQESFVSPLLGQATTPLRMASGSLDDLLQRLADHALDVVLSNRRPRTEIERGWRCRMTARQQVSLVGRDPMPDFHFPQDLSDRPIIVPGQDSDIRTEFNAICERLNLRPRILAEVDDMATMRLFARDSGALALLPSVVVRDELRSGALQDYGPVPGLFESFYAITVERRYQHPMLPALLAREEADILAMPA